MQEYFKTMHAMASLSDKEYDSIRELTIDIAKSNGYHKGLVTLKNGRVVERTLYNKPSTWDDVLVAKWFCFYEKTFYSELLKHPELEEYYTTIMARTFSIMFNSLTLEKLTSDRAVTSLFLMTLGCRIGDAFYLVGSESRLQDYLNKKDDRITMKSAINKMAVSFDAMYEAVGDSALVSFCKEVSDNDTTNEVVIDLKEMLSGNKLGLKLLDSMLHTDRRVVPKSIDKFVDLEDMPLSDYDKEELTSAWNTIKAYLRDSMLDNGQDVSKYDWNKKVKFSTSFGENGLEMSF